MRRIEIIWYLLLLMAILCFALCMLAVVVPVKFHLVATAFGMLTVIFGAVKSNRQGQHALKIMVSSILLAACVLIADGIVVITHPRERHTEYISPAGTTTLIVEYDFASRPHLYRKRNRLLMEKVAFVFGPGYNETVNHTVVWLSESTVRLEDDFGGAWIVDIP